MSDNNPGHEARHAHPLRADRVAGLGNERLNIVVDGQPDAPAMLLIHGSAGCTTWWDPVVPHLAEVFRVIRVDLAGHGSSITPDGGYDIPSHSRRIKGALDRLGGGPVTVVGHSMGCLVATALAEQCPDAVAGLGLIDMGPSMDAAVPEGWLVHLMLKPFPGRLLWRMRNETMLRKAMASAVTRPVALPDSAIAAALGMTHRALAGTSRGATAYLRERSLPDRLATLGLPVLVIFGAKDARYHPWSADAYRSVPAVRVEVLSRVGHTPMLEDAPGTGALLRDFAASASHPH